MSKQQTIKPKGPDVRETGRYDLDLVERKLDLERLRAIAVAAKAVRG
jgi:hypothetical protein